MRIATLAHAVGLKTLVFPLPLLLAAVVPAATNEPRQAAASSAPASAAQVVIGGDTASSRPGAEHRWLDPLVGRWNAELRWLAAGQGEIRTSGTSENRWILGGRFLLCESTAGEGSSQVEATTIYGFDNREKRFFALGLHSQRTSYTERSGSYDPATQSFLLSGKERDEVHGGVLVYRELVKIEGPDRHVLTVYVDVPGRTPVKVLEAVFTRR